MRNAALVLAGIAAAQIVLAPALAYLGVLPPLRAFQMWIFAALPGLAAIATALTGLLLRRIPLPVAAAAIVLGAVPLVVVGSIVRAGRRVPRINDVTTDLDDPPSFVQAKELPANRGRDFAYPERFKPRVREAYGDLGPVVRDGSAGALLEKAIAAAKELGWTVTAIDDRVEGGREARFEAVVTSGLWRFQDDVVVRVREENGKARLDVRSKSRDGQNDFGANAGRIRALIAKL